MIPVYEPYIGPDEIRSAVDCLSRGVISGAVQGDYIGTFERLVAEVCGVRHAVATTSGTTALALAVASLGMSHGDEVLVPSLTNVATAFAAVYSGAVPVFLDSEGLTWNVDPAGIREAVTPRTRAIIPVHLYGHPADMEPIMEIASELGLYVIEDAAEAQGAEYRGKQVGGIGHVGCFSFFINKVITTGEGGMLVTDDDGIAERARSLKNLGYSGRGKFMHNELAYNFRLTNLQAAVGVAQMRRLNEIVERKRRVAALYSDRLRHVEGLRLPVEQPWAKNVYWMYGIVLEEGLPDRDAVRERLEALGVETRPFFHPLHLQPVFQKMGVARAKGALPVCERLGARGLYLPSSPMLTEAEVDMVCERVKEALRRA